MTGADANTQDTSPAVTTHPLLGVVGVLLGGLIALGRAAELLGLQVHQQAYTLAISDSFLLLATCCVACLVVVSFMSKVPTQYRQVTAASVEAK
jgi:hypothetical protein